MTQTADGRNRAAITLCVMLATILQVLDSTIANVALPHMQGSLSAAQDTITWVLTSYIVASAIATPLTGWLSDRIGRKQLFLVSIGGFTLVSVLCGLASSLNEMVVFRLLQGMFGATLVPLSQSVMLDIYPRERQAQAMTMWGAGIMIGPIIGPTLGGWLTDSFNWRWVFFVNLPLGILAFAGLFFLLPNTLPQKRRFDFLGFGLLAAAIGALQLMLDRGERQDWFASSEIWVEMFVAIGTFWMFVIHLMTSEHSFLDRRLFADRNLVSSLCFGLIVGMVLIGVMALLPPMLQSLLGYSTFESGLAMAPRGMGTMTGMILLGRFSRHFDPRSLLMSGLIVIVITMWWMTHFTIMMGWEPILVSGFVQGFGVSLLFAPLSQLSLSTIAPQLRTQGASVYNLVRNIGSSIGVSVLSTELAQNTQINHAQLAEHISPFNPMWNEQVIGVYGAAAGPYAQSIPAMIDMEVNRQALLIAYLNDFKLIMWTMLVSFPVVFLLKRANLPGAPGRKIETVAPKGGAGGERPFEGPVLDAH